MILPTKARENEGFCAPCARMGPKLRAERQAHLDAIESGTIFHPTDAEREGARNPTDVLETTVPWRLSPSLYAEGEPTSLDVELSQLTRSGEGAIYLGTDATHHLVVELKAGRGVCTFVSGFENEDRVSLYAHGPDNAITQIPRDEQIWAGCACCGIGTIPHASRAHMPAEKALAIFRKGLAHDYSGTTWLGYEPDNFISRGSG